MERGAARLLASQAALNASQHSLGSSLRKSDDDDDDLLLALVVAPFEVVVGVDLFSSLLFSSLCDDS